MLKNTSIPLALQLVFGATIVAIVALSIYLLLALNNIQNQFVTVVDRNVSLLSTVSNLRYYTVTYRRFALDYGLTDSDKFFARWLRKKNKPIICLVNKCEGTKGLEGLEEATRLGFDSIPISAEHNEGMADLFDALDVYKTEYDKQYGDLEINMNSDHEEKCIQIAIVGRFAE